MFAENGSKQFVLRFSPWPRSQNASSRVGDKIRVNLHHGKIEDAIVKAIIQQTDGTKLQVDVVGLDLTALIDTSQVRD
jgi:hypothetical protein